MSSRATLGIGVGAGSGALSGALAGIPAAAGTYGLSIVIGAAIGAALGAGVGALPLLLGKPSSKKNNAIELQTTSIRDTPVPVVFGRTRIGGNLIDIGAFEIRKDAVGGTPGGHVKIGNYAVALCEGPILALGNVHQDNITIDAVRKDFKSYSQYTAFDTVVGTSTQAISADITDPDRKYPSTNVIPWRNTAYVVARTVIGGTARLVDFTFDIYGPNYAIQRSGSTAESNSNDTSLYCGYDGYTEQFYYTLTSSGASSAPFGIVTVGRQGGTRVHTPPPSGMGTATHAWYLGRHDIVVMQDPANLRAFWIGYWGITPSSPDWEWQQPHTGYVQPILAHYLDELHGMLHTLHDDGTYRYILRWNLLTGRVDRLNTALPVASYLQLMYSPDFAQYITNRGAATLDFIDPDTGEAVATYVATGVSAVKGICVSGQLVGMLTSAGFYYYAPYSQTQYGPYGSAASTLDTGALGATSSAVQNSWTGHVTIFKSSIGIINFIPSVVEDYLDVNANGSSYVYQPLKGGADFQWLPGPQTVIDGDGRYYRNPVYPPASPSDSKWYTDNTIGWVRDWSKRTYNTWTLNALTGFSSLAAAMWACLVDEPNLDSKRWGGGLSSAFFSLSSFESVHSYCVGGMRYQSPDATFRLAERYKFDYTVDSETSLSDLVANQMLTACQGYRAIIDGKMHVGIQRQGMFPVWHFSDANIVQDSFQLKFIGRGQGANKVRVSYRNIMDEYATDFAEATDDFDIATRRRVQLATLALRGVGRFNHADLLAKQTLDQAISARRQATFKTHFVWAILSPADGIEVSERQANISRVPMRVTVLSEGEAGECEITALEHVPVLDVVKGANESSGIDGGSSPDIIGTDNCQYQTCMSDGTLIWFNSGTAYANGNYLVTYLFGTYAPDVTWDYAVAGFDLVTRNSGGTIVVLAAAPGISVPNPGYSTQAAAEAANAGQNVTITLTTSGPIGLRRAVGGTTMPAGSTMPTYQLCPA